MSRTYLKVPTETAEYALRERKTSKLAVYLSGQFIYPGKARVGKKTVSDIGKACNLKARSVYTSFKWLINRDWMGKDSKNGWFFFRSINEVHQHEKWKHSRSALMFKDDLKSIKAFFIGAFLSSVCKSGNSGTGTERTNRRSVRTLYPVSLSFIQNALNVSKKTAFNYRKYAEKYEYIKMYPNLKETTLSINDLRTIRANKPNRIKVPLFGSSKSIVVHHNQLVLDRGNVKVQLPNLILPNVLLKKRKLRRYKYQAHTTGGSC